MKTIVVLNTSYYPNYSANGNCCNKILNEIANEYRIIVVCLKSATKQEEYIRYENQEIIRVTFKEWSKRLRVKEALKTAKGIYKLLNTIRLYLIKTRLFLNIIKSPRTIENDKMKAFLDALNQIDGNIDVLLPLCFPMESVVASYEFIKTNQNTRLIPIFFDPFVESDTAHRLKLNRIIKQKNNMALQQRIFEKAERIICGSYLQTIFQDNKEKDKFIYIDLPLMKPSKIEICQENKEDNTRLVYLGSLNRIVRNPDYALKIMEIISNKYSDNIVLDIYAYGNCKRIIRKYEKKSKGKIRSHNVVPKDRAEEIMHESDVLLSIGNNNEYQLPSKIYEYMAMGKTIVHIYKHENEATKKILEKYPLALCVKEDITNLLINARLISEFCSNMKNKIIDYEYIAKNYLSATPGYVSRTIVEIIEKKK